MKIIQILFLLLISLSLFSQKEEIINAEISRKNDSLIKVQNQAVHDTTRVKIFGELSRLYMNNNPVKAIQYAEQGLNLAQKINFKKGISQSYNALGLCYFNQGDYLQSIEHFKESLKIEEELNNTRGISLCYNNLGRVYTCQGNFTKAIEFYRKSLKIAEKINDKIMMAHCYGNIGVVHLNQRNYNSAIEYYEKSLKINEELGHKYEIAICYMNLGSVCYEMNDLIKAADYDFKSMKIAEELGNYGLLSDCLNNLGTVYFDRNEIEKSLNYIEKSLKIRTELGDKQGVAVCYGNLAGLYNHMQKYDDAIANAEKSLKISSNIGSLTDKKEAIKYLIEANKGLKNYQKAVEYLEEYKVINDSIFSIEKNKQLVKVEAIYQNEKKQKEIELQRVQLSKNEFQRNAFLGGFIFVLLLAFIVFISYRQKRNDNKLLQIQKHEISEKNEELNQQNEEIKAQRDLIQEQSKEVFQQNEEIISQRDLIEQQLNISEEHRLLITHQKKELTDSINYAQRIQRAILPPDYFVKQCMPESFILYFPKDVVSGDFYYVDKQGDNVIFAAVDCTGHGVPGSMMSVIGYNLINQAVKLNQISKPSDILSFLDEGVTQTLRQEHGESGVNDGMDLAICTWNTVSNELQFAGAYNSMVYVKNGELTEIKGENLAIGVNYDGVVDSYTNHTVQLNKGDCVYLYSDGYADQFGGPKGKKFKYKPLKDILLANSSKPIRDQLSELQTIFNEWKGSLEQVDDVMVIGLMI